MTQANFLSLDQSSYLKHDTIQFYLKHDTIQLGVRPAILAILNKQQCLYLGRRIARPDRITSTLRPRRPRVQAAALLRRFNLDVAKQDRAACFHDLAGANATEDAINKTLADDNGAGETGDPHHPRTGHITCGLAVLRTFSRLTLRTTGL